MGGNVIKLPSDYIKEGELKGELKRKSMMLNNVRSIISRFTLSLDDAMDVINLSGEDRQYCREQLAQSEFH